MHMFQGFTGGLLIDADGSVIGINSRGLAG